MQYMENTILLQERFWVRLHTRAVIPSRIRIVRFE